MPYKLIVLQDLVGFNRCSCLEPACSCNISENTRIKKKNMNHNCNMKGKTFPVGSNCLNDEFNNFVIKCGDADLKKVNRNTQVLFISFGNVFIFIHPLILFILLKSADF